MKELLNQNGLAWYFCEILKQPVLEPDGTSLGRVADLAVADLEHEAPIKGLVVAGAHRRRQYLTWDLVERLEPKGVRVRPGASKALCEATQPPGQILLGKGLLDRQIVDIEGAKVVRVNDLQLRQRNGQLILSKVDVGLKSLLRRVVSASLGDKKSDIAELFAKYGLRALPAKMDASRLQKTFLLF